MEETEQGIEEVEQMLRKLGHNKSDCLIVKEVSGQVKYKFNCPNISLLHLTYNKITVLQKKRAVMARHNIYLLF